MRLESVVQRLASEIPEIAPHAGHIASRLSLLLIKRLPADLSRKMAEILPEIGWISEEFLIEEDRTLGWPQFTEHAALLIPMAWSWPEQADRMESREDAECVAEILADRVACIFLRQLLQELPDELRLLVEEALPTEILVHIGLSREELKTCHKIPA